ncbi:hypothetical protein B0H63DRAFT_398207 [Podospora didyma]|uniref:Uncharacterized protein n=1 Tax=Podospora didyma TaxID=330526 RepID=A0AAE0NB40_9PEZI|nr:hypothetical protein B0H63DRAFT_398207 [Podospora didyma]
MAEVLLWLWQTTAKPILNALGHRSTTSPTETKARVHWIGTGIVSTAPFHAAGKHSDGSTENVMSSYISTLRALSLARETLSKERGRTSGIRDKKHLIVSVPDAPGANHLPSRGKPRLWPRSCQLPVSTMPLWYPGFTP